MVVVVRAEDTVIYEHLAPGGEAVNATRHPAVGEDKGGCLSILAIDVRADIALTNDRVGGRSPVIEIIKGALHDFRIGDGLCSVVKKETAVDVESLDAHGGEVHLVGRIQINIAVDARASDVVDGVVLESGAVDLNVLFDIARILECTRRERDDGSGIGSSGESLLESGEAVEHGSLVAILERGGSLVGHLSTGKERAGASHEGK